MSLTLANKLTLSRILSVPLFISAFSMAYAGETNAYRVAFGLYCYAVFTDALDGYIARTRRQETRMGTFLDPLADKLLLISAFVCWTFVPSDRFILRLPVWVLAVALSRDILLAAGAVVLKGKTGRFSVDVSPWGKLTTFFWMATVMALFIQWKGAVMFWWGGSVFAVISLVDYCRSAAMRLSRRQRE